MTRGIMNANGDKRISTTYTNESYLCSLQHQIHAMDLLHDISID